MHDLLAAIQSAPRTTEYTKSFITRTRSRSTTRFWYLIVKFTSPTTGSHCRSTAHQDDFEGCKIKDDLLLIHFSLIMLFLAPVSISDSTAPIRKISALMVGLSIEGGRMRSCNALTDPAPPGRLSRFPRPQAEGNHGRNDHIHGTRSIALRFYYLVVAVLQKQHSSE